MRSKLPQYPPESPAMKVFILLCIYLATASADELLNIAGNNIDLPEGEALLVKCQGKSIDVMITGAEPGKWAVELQNSEHCDTTKSKPNCNKNMRSENSDFDTYLKKIDPKTLEYHDLRYSNYETTTKKFNELFIAIEDEGVWTGIEEA